MNILLGTKRGMTQIWDEEGNRIPVTVVDVAPNAVVALKTIERDGYEAVQLGTGTIREKRLSKPLIGHFKKAGVGQRRHLREVRGPAGEHTVGEELGAGLFEVGTIVDVIGTSKGKGFQGTIKLHHFSRGPESHGSDNVRKPGSIGMHTHPGRTLRGKRMANKMGNERVTIRQLKVMRVDAEQNVLLIQGAVPGNNGGLLMVRKSSRQPRILTKKGGA
ncbi:MAG: 50S ribosomal protein L3 [Planctomycetota bacterium]